MSQLFSGKDNHIEYQLFDADAKYRVPTMKNRLGRYDLLSRIHFIIRGFSP